MKNWKSWKSWEYLKQWNTYFYAFFAEFLVGRGDIVVCFRRADYGGVVGNLIVAALFVPVVLLCRYFYHVYTKGTGHV
jgi:hypothetical protein